MHFDQFATDYQEILDRSVAASGETSEYFASYKARYLNRVLSSSFSGKILDFGCGIGLLSGLLRQYLPMAQVDGFDVSADSVRQVSPLLTGQGVFTSNKAELARDYRLIVISHVLHHIPPPERQETIGDLARRLLLGGKLSIFEHNPANPVTRWVVAQCPFDEDAVLLPPSETKTYLRQAKLTLIRQDYTVFMPRLLAWLRPLEPWLRWMPLGAQYAIMAEKHA